MNINNIFLSQNPWVISPLIANLSPEEKETLQKVGDLMRKKYSEEQQLQNICSRQEKTKVLDFWKQAKIAYSSELEKLGIEEFATTMEEKAPIVCGQLVKAMKEIGKLCKTNMRVIKSFLNIETSNQKK